MDLMNLRECFNKFHNYIHTAMHDIVISTSLSKGHQDNFMYLSVSISPINNSPWMPSDDYLSVLMTKDIMEWSDIDHEAAKAIAAAIKHYNELPSSSKCSNCYETYNLGHKISITDKISDPNGIAKVSKSKFINVVEKLTKSNDIPVNAKIATAISLKKSANKFGLVITDEWLDTIVPPELCEIFKAIDRAKNSGMDKADIKQGVLRSLNHNSEDLDMFSHCQIGGIPSSIWDKTGKVI